MSPPAPPRAPRGSALSLWIVLAAFALLAGWLASSLNLWRDEAYTLWSISGDLRTTLERTVDFSQLLPLYFVLLHFWSLAWDSPTLDRLSSVLLVAGAIAAVWALSKRALPRLSPALLPILLATHPLALWAAVELRPYALILLLSALLMLVHEIAYGSDERRLRPRLAYVALAAASLYTQYFLGYLLAGLGAGLLAAGRVRAAFRYLADMAVVFVLCLPVWTTTAQQVGDRVRDQAPPPGLAGQVRIAAERLEAFVFPITTAAIEAGLSEDQLRVAMRTIRATVLLAVVALLVTLRREPGRLLSPRHRAWTTAVAVYAAFVVFTISVGGISMVSPRHTIALLVPALATTLLWFHAGPRLGLVYGVAGLMLAGNLAASAVRFQPLAKECDCERVAAWIESQEAPGEPILVFIAEDALALRLHYRGANAIVPVPREPIHGLDGWDPHDFVLRDARDVETALAAVDPGARAIWVFKSATEAAFGFEFGREHLEEFLRRDWRETARREFHGGVLVRRFGRALPPPEPPARP